MKNLFILCIAAALTISTGCDKESPDFSGLQGTWELRHILGVQIAGAPSDFPPGNGHLVKFIGDTFEMHEQGKLMLSSAFNVKRDELEIDGERYSFKFVYQDSGHEKAWHVKVSGNKLLMSLGSTASDGVTVTYEKQ